MCQYVNFTDKLDVETKYKYYQNEFMGFPGGSEVQVSACNAGDLGSIPQLGRSPGEGNGNPLQYSCLEKSHRWISLVGYSPWDRKVSDMTE